MHRVIINGLLYNFEQIFVDEVRTNKMSTRDKSRLTQDWTSSVDKNGMSSRTIVKMSLSLCSRMGPALYIIVRI